MATANISGTAKNGKRYWSYYDTAQTSISRVIIFEGTEYVMCNFSITRISGVSCNVEIKIDGSWVQYKTSVSSLTSYVPVTCQGFGFVQTSASSSVWNFLLTEY